jgi:repressor LexA
MSLDKERVMQTEPRTSDIVFAYIGAYIEQRGYPPSVRDIARACQMSTTSVHYALTKLEDLGWIAREPRVARGLRVLRHDEAAPKLEQK